MFVSADDFVPAVKKLPLQLGDIREKELIAYNGSDPKKPLLIAIKGQIYDVSTSKTLIGKIFGSIGSVGGGLALGKERPLVHFGACIASLLGQGGSTKYHLRSRWFQIFISERDRRDLDIGGSGTTLNL